MIGSTLVLAMGVMFLVAVRLSGQARAYGFVVFAGIVLVAVACALHLSQIIGVALRTAPRGVRAAVILAAWSAVGVGTTWLLGRAPRAEVLVALLVVPLALGAAGVATTRRAPWPAVAFLLTAAALSATVAPILIARYTSG